MNGNLLRLGKIALAIAAIALVSALQAASAATTKMEVKVPGVPGWVLVKQNAWPKYGGRVVWEPEHGRYVTDDVARGETMRITVSPDPGESTAPNAARFGIWCEANQKYLLGLQRIRLPYVRGSYVVPRNTAFDNLYVDVYSSLGRFPSRIPIGPRVR